MINEIKTAFGTFLLAIIFLIVFPVSINAQTANTPKEEVVYANLSPTGTVNDINIVNIFEAPNSGVIVDYGSYQTIRNMTGTEEIKSTQDLITVNGVKEGKLFYEGHLENTTIPWDVRITYYLNGMEKSAQEMAGQNGLVEIHLNVNQNKNCSGSFYDKYALQANITLDTDKFKNIISDGATVANVGKDKQLTYTILPGKGINTVIKANVTDFELDAITMNGIPLNLDIDIDKSELTNRVNELNDALSQLDNGSGELTDGISTLKSKVSNDLLTGTRTLHSGSTDLVNGVSQERDGLGTLNDGASQLEDGADSLSSGTTELKDGIDQIETGLETLNSKSASLTGGSEEFKNALKQLQEAVNNITVSSDGLTELSQGSTQLKEGINQLEEGITTLNSSLDSNEYKKLMNQNGLNIDELQSKNQETIKSLTQQVEELSRQIAELEQQGVDVSALVSQVEELKGIIQLLRVDSAAIEGSMTYLETVGEQSLPLVEGAQNLRENYQTFDDSLQALITELSNLLSKMTELTQGVNTLVTEYDKLDQGITDYTDGVSQILDGYSKVSEGSTRLVNGSTSLKKGVQSLHSGSESLLSGMNKLYDGSGTLNNGVGNLESGVISLDSGVITLLDGSKKLSDGTAELKANTSGIDDEITRKIDDTISSISGDNIPVKSFVSEKNTNIKSVQFVLKTEPVKVVTPETTTGTRQTELNFWQKLLKLFGLYKEN